MINTETHVDFSLTANKQKPKFKITELVIKTFMLSFIVLSISQYTFNVLNLKKISIVGSQHYSENEILQASGLGLLRGIQDVQLPFILALLSYWIFGIGSGYILGFVLNKAKELLNYSPHSLEESLIKITQQLKK